MIKVKVTDLAHNREIGIFTLKELCMANPFIDYGEKNLKIELIEQEPTAKEQFYTYIQNSAITYKTKGEIKILFENAIKEAEERNTK